MEYPELHISEEILSQAQIEGANYLRALGFLMDEMRHINEKSKLLPYFRRFYALHTRIYYRFMIILAVGTDFSDTASRDDFFRYQQELLSEKKELLRMIATMRSTHLSCQCIAAYKESDWCKQIYTMADDLFDDWEIGPGNKLSFSPE